MLNRLGLVIHWMGFTLGVMVFVISFGGLVVVTYDEWNTAHCRADPNLTRFCDPVDEIRPSGLPEGFTLTLTPEQQAAIDRVRGVTEKERDFSLGDVLGEFTNPWYLYFLGLLFSPLLIVLIMLPAWLTRFILTGEKVFFPWRSADA
jgi:hypothetical protein